jgi:hypothetical protein
MNMKRMLTVRKKKKGTASKCSEKEAKRNFLRGTKADFATEKLDDSNVDEDKRFLLSLLPSFRQFNDEQKFLARMEILKIMRHVKLQQNLDTNSSCSFPSFSNAKSVPPISSHFANNPLNSQPVTSLQDSETLSRYLSSYSVQTQSPPASTKFLPQYPSSPCPISSNAPLLPAEVGSNDVSSLLSIGSTAQL